MPPHRRLGERHHVGRDAEMLVGEPLAGPAAAGLHLVEHQQQPCSSHSSRRPCRKPRADADAPFALDRLDQMAHVSSSISRADGVEVAERGVDESRPQRPEPLVVLRLGRGRQVAPSVRPWKPPSNVMILYAPWACSRASLIAASLASAPLLQKNAWPPKLAR
jgi:hypothetical protein